MYLPEDIFFSNENRVLAEVNAICACVHALSSVFKPKDQQQQLLLEQEQSIQLQKLEFHSQSFKLLFAVSERTFYTDTLVVTTKRFLDHLQELYDWYTNNLHT